MEGGNFVRVQTRLIRPISVGLVKFIDLKLTASAERHGTVWLPRLLDVRSRFKILFQTRRHHNTYEYFDFNSIAPPGR